MEVGQTRLDFLILSFSIPPHFSSATSLNQVFPHSHIYTTISPLLTLLPWARKVHKSLPYLKAKQTCLSLHSLFFNTTRFPLSNACSFFPFSQTSLTSQTWAGALHKSRVFIPREYNRWSAPGGHFSRHWKFSFLCNHSTEPGVITVCLFVAQHNDILVLLCPNHSAVFVLLSLFP